IFLLILCGTMAFLISLLITVFAIKYRRSKQIAAEQIEGNNTLEITWSVIPLCIFMVIFVWGASVYYEGSRPPKNSDEIWVVAKQWMWKLQHLDGQREINELHVPVGRDIKLNM